MGKSPGVIGVLILACLNMSVAHGDEIHILDAVPLGHVEIRDAFWGPKLRLWSRTTVNDVLDKFEESGAFRNFDRVAGIEAGNHEGPPWYDGLVYETIRAASDFLVLYPDANLEKKLDGYIRRITAAQERSTDGYILTYTQLEEPGHRWGLNGGYQRWLHELYNAGALVEAGIHHYRATGKAGLLEVAVRFANHICDIIGPSPKMCVVPSHSLPEEAFVELYVLLDEDASLKNKMSVPVDARRFLSLAEYWLESRGNHCGLPTSEQWDNDEPACHAWIREQGYLGKGRPSWGAYAQDHRSIFRQETIEGHAVRATLMCAGLSAAARINRSQEYADAAARLWDNLVGKRLHITGGAGAIAHEEKFGPDYFLPNTAYLETCSAVGAAFFHRNMNLLFGHSRYVDELERVLYNNILNGVSLAGDRYYYQNPLKSLNRSRWSWHGCPCCPPMFLKIVSAMPGYIYALDDEGLHVNLFVGSKVALQLNETRVTVRQTTDYPWKGTVRLALQLEKPTVFTVYVRIPGWARGSENAFELYRSDLDKSQVTLKVNGQVIARPDMVRGYAAIDRLWKAGDTITLSLPMNVRRVHADPRVQADVGRVALQSGPLVYCLEGIDNPQQVSYYLEPDPELSLAYKPDWLEGINVIQSQALGRQDREKPKRVQLTAIPFYCQANRGRSSRIDVWIPERQEIATALGLASVFEASASHCFANDTVGAINDGVEPSNSNDHSIARHTWWDRTGTTQWAQYDFDKERSVSSVAVYWWDDRPAGGGCAVPESWRLLYRNGGRWEEVQADADYGVEKDRFNEVRFDPVRTTSLRIEAKLRDGFSGGILEWKVR